MLTENPKAKKYSSFKEFMDEIELEKDEYISINNYKYIQKRW